MFSKMLDKDCFHLSLMRASTTATTCNDHTQHITARVFIRHHAQPIFVTDFFQQLFGEVFERSMLQACSQK